MNPADISVLTLPFLLVCNDTWQNIDLRYVVAAPVRKKKKNQTLDEWGQKI